MELNKIWEQGGAEDRDIALCDSLAGPSWPSGSMAPGFSLAGLSCVQVNGPWVSLKTQLSPQGGDEDNNSETM